MSELTSESSAGNIAGLWWCSQCQRYIQHDLSKICPHNSQAEEIARLRRELIGAQAQARNWESSAIANKDLAMGYQNQARETKRELAAAREEVKHLEATVREVAQSDFALGNPWLHYAPVLMDKNLWQKLRAEWGPGRRDAAKSDA